MTAVLYGRYKILGYCFRFISCRQYIYVCKFDITCRSFWRYVGGNAGRTCFAGTGTSEWGVEYQAGSTGGEHEHQLSVGELPEHGHAAICSTNGEHVHTAPTYNGSGGAPNGRISEVDRVNRASTVTVDKAGSHSHTISVSDTGKNLSHNNMSPYLSVIYEELLKQFFSSRKLR